MNCSGDPRFDVDACPLQLQTELKASNSICILLYLFTFSCICADILVRFLQPQTSRKTQWYVKYTRAMSWAVFFTLAAEVVRLVLAQTVGVSRAVMFFFYQCPLIPAVVNNMAVYLLLLRSMTARSTQSTQVVSLYLLIAWYLAYALVLGAEAVVLAMVEPATQRIVEITFSIFNASILLSLLGVSAAVHHRLVQMKKAFRNAAATRASFVKLMKRMTATTTVTVFSTPFLAVVIVLQSVFVPVPVESGSIPMLRVHVWVWVLLEILGAFSVTILCFVWTKTFDVAVAKTKNSYFFRGNTLEVMEAAYLEKHPDLKSKLESSEKEIMDRTTIELQTARHMAMWWRYPPKTVADFFCFPSVIATGESRIHAFLSGSTLLLAYLLDVFLGFHWLYFYVWYGFFIRTLCGPRLDPQAWLVQFFLSPLLIVKYKILSASFVFGEKKRFQQFCGFIFMTSIIIVRFAIPSYLVPEITGWMVGILAMFMYLQALCNLCLVCGLYYLVETVRERWGSPEDISQETHKPVLPGAPDQRQKSRAQAHVHMIVLEDSTTHTSHASPCLPHQPKNPKESGSSSTTTASINTVGVCGPGDIECMYSGGYRTTELILTNDEGEERASSAV